MVAWTKNEVQGNVRDPLVLVGVGVLVGDAIVGVHVYARIHQLLVPIEVPSLVWMLKVVDVTWYCHLLSSLPPIRASSAQTPLRHLRPVQVSCADCRIPLRSYGRI